MILNELNPLASFKGSMLADVIKQQIGPRVLDMAKTWSSDSLNAGRTARLKGFAFFLGSAARELLMSNFSQIVMGSAMTLYTFDWNKSDKQIEEELKATEAQMYGAAGRLIGSGAVRMVGIQATKKARNLYPQVNPEILIGIEDEQRDEIKSAISGMLTGMRTAMQKQALLSTYASGRKLFGYKEEKDKDGKDKPREPWILSSKLEDWAESSKDKNTKAFFTNLKDEAEDAVFDLGYMITNGVQTHWNMTQQAIEASLGEKKIIKYTPDITDPLVHTFLQGSEESIKTSINTARIEQIHMESKDVGQIAMVGIQRAMRADLSERILNVDYYSGANGATQTIDGRAKHKTFKISNIKKTADWDKFKKLFKPVQAGPIKVTAKLSDGHELQGYFSSEAEGKSFFTPIIESICIGNLVSFQAAAIPSDIRKRVEILRFEVASAKLFISDSTADEKQGKYIARDGKLKRTKTIKIKLNGKKKPEGIDAIIQVPFPVTFK